MRVCRGRGDVNGAGGADSDRTAGPGDGLVAPKLTAAAMAMNVPATEVTAHAVRREHGCLGAEPASAGSSVSVVGVARGIPIYMVLQGRATPPPTRQVVLSSVVPSPPRAFGVRVPAGPAGPTGDHKDKLVG